MPYNEKLTLEVTADNNASDKINKVTDSVKNLDKESNQMTGKMASGWDNALSSIDKGFRKIDQFNSTMRHYNNMMSGYNRAVLGVFKDAGAAIYDFTSDAIDNYTELSEQHAKTLGAMANNYDKSIQSQSKFLSDAQKLKDQAIQLGMYGVNGNGSLTNAVGVSQTQTELVKAGLNADQILNGGATQSILTFAQANGLDTGSAVEFAVSLGNQFNIPVNQWGSMLDKVSHTADLSIIDVADIVQSMKYASGISSGVGKSLDETLGMVGVLGDFGLRGSQAGSSIQALLTRILTGDTTVITDAMAEVAPPKALDAFYKFEKAAKPNGELLPMNTVIDQLDETMGGLNDEEQAWFAKKLFGLYQMKGAYALISGDNNALEETVNNIETQSEGSNENKYNQLLNSQYGQLESLNNMWDTLKTDLGNRANPFVDAVRDELFNFLSNSGNYSINFDGLRDALDESADLIEEKYGIALGDAVRNLGGTTIDLAQVAQGIAPEFASGILDVFGKLIQFDVPGTMSEWNGMIGDMKDAVGDLPEDLQGLGNTVVNVIDFFGKLTALNVVTQIAELVSSVLQVLHIAGGAIINATSVVVNGTGIGGAGNTGAGAGGAATAAGAGTAATAATTASALSSTTWGATGLPLVLGTMVKGAGYAYLLDLAMKSTGDSFKIGDYAGTMSDNSKQAIEDFLGAMPAGSFDKVKYADDYYARGKTYDTMYGDVADGIRRNFENGEYAGNDILLAIQSVLMGYDASNVEFGKEVNPNTGETVVTYKDKKTGKYLNNRDEGGNLLPGWGWGLTDFTANTTEQFEPMAMYISQLVYSYEQLMGANGRPISTNQAQQVTQLLADKMGQMWQSGNYTMDKNGLFGTDELGAIIKSLFTGDTKVSDYYGISELIPGIDGVNEYGRNQIMMDYIRKQNELHSAQPSIVVNPPSVNVDVHVDKDGNIIKQVSVLDPSFNGFIHKWYNKNASQYGQTNK
jgi:TP901 family phage tail tape measure protein